MIKIGRLFVLLSALLFATGMWAQDEGSISASASRTTVGLNEPFRVVFSTDIRFGEIEAPNFEHFIIVRGPFSSQQTNIINGSVSVRREVSFDLVAQEEGVFTIAPATINKRGSLTRSNTLTITVKEGAQRSNRLSEAAKEAFEVSILASKKEVYVGEPVVLLFRATLFERVREMNILQEPNFEQALQQKLDFDQEQRFEVINGKRATVLDFDKRLLIPNKSGTLGGQELKITGRVQVPTGQVDFFGMPLTKFVQEVATADVPAVRIKPLPTPRPDDFSGAVGEFTFSRELSHKELAGEESLTIKVRVQGTGNFNVVSVPELVAPQGFDVYDPKYDENIRYSERGVRGYKELEYLLVPQFKGKFIVPEVRWTFFNTATGRYEEVVLPEEEVVVNSSALAEADSSVYTSAVVKREVSDIEQDIRYLQEKNMRPFIDLKLKNISFIIFSLLGLAWLLQALTLKERTEDPEKVKARQKAAVDKAFKTEDEQRFAIMMNALEARILERGIAREAISSTSLVEAYGEEIGRLLHSVLERCQLAQYAPVQIGSTERLQNDFKRLWNEI